MTSRIKLLPENLINRIAAGEVVERPASILKELVENSLDSGATKIEIETQNGGKKLIRVTDNGCGMNKEELFLCLERHATSKLGPQSDLLDIKTLGFRGEALPSISSVSRLSILSATENDIGGFRIRIEGGKLLGLEPAPANHGTTVEVKDIFYNIPARRKFLKTESTEQIHLIDVAQRYALSRTNLRIKMTDGDKEILSVDDKQNLEARMAKILGADIAKNLRPFEFSEDDLEISGYLGGPETAGRTSSMLFLFVLGRPVKDRLLTKAITQGYGKILPSGRWPAGLVFINLDPFRVDVNVHPAKTEVRFREANLIFSSLVNAVNKTISASPVSFGRDHNFNDSRANETNENFINNKTTSSTYEKGKINQKPFDYYLEDSQQSQTQNLKSFSQPDNTRSKAISQISPPWMDEEENQKTSKIQSVKETKLNEQSQLSNQLNNTSQKKNDITEDYQSSPKPDEKRIFDQTSQKSLLDDGRLEVKPLAQLNQSYILAQGPEGLYLIDQHAAHERIIFNRLNKILHQTGVPTQYILLPETIEFSSHQALAANHLSLALNKIGFDLEPFGETTFVLKGIPSILKPSLGREALLEILSAAQEHLKSFEGSGLNKIIDDMSGSWLYSLACRAAIKAGQKLTIEEMENLIKDLYNAESGGYCPHGRPSVIVLSYHDLEKKFGRI